MPAVLDKGAFIEVRRPSRGLCGWDLCSIFRVSTTSIHPSHEMHEDPALARVAMHLPHEPKDGRARTLLGRNGSRDICGSRVDHPQEGEVFGLDGPSWHGLLR